MSLTNEQYDTIMRIYSRRQADNRFRQKERQQAVYDAIPAPVFLPAVWPRLHWRKPTGSSRISPRHIRTCFCTGAPAPARPF